METTRPVGIVETAWDQSLRGKRFASSSVLLLLMWVFFQYSQRLVLKSLHRPQFCCHYSSTKTKSAMKGFIILAHGLIVHFLKSLGIEGLIYSGFWAQRPYYIRFLGYFDPQGIARAWGSMGLRGPKHRPVQAHFHPSCTGESFCTVPLPGL